MPLPELTVTCFCAEWCSTCREYRNPYLRLESRFPAAAFRWLDIDYDAAEVGDLEVENFPTVRIERRGAVLFQGVLPPQAESLAQLLESLLTTEKPT
jgi:hypothetical protein